MSIVVRKAVPADLSPVVEILNHGVKTRHSIGYYESRTADEMKEWFEEHVLSSRYPLLIAEEDGHILGWISMSPYRKGREAFNRTGEVSAYVHENYLRTGLGQLLLDRMLEFASESGSELFSPLFSTGIFQV